MKKILLMIGLLFLPVLVCATDMVVGLHYHDVNNLFSGRKVERGADLGLEVLLGDGVVRPHLGFTSNSNRETSKIYSGITFSTTRPGVFVCLSVGGGIHFNSVRHLGSKVLIRLSTEVGYSFDNSRVSLILDHISNADLFENNDGLDIIGFRYGWRF